MLEDILRRSSPEWTKGSGPDSDVVISSRIRLARNLELFPFPHMMDEAAADEVLGHAGRVTAGLNESGGWGSFEMFRLNDMSALERQVLVEKHLISPQHSQDPRGKAVILGRDETVSIMVNEEDHLRIQCLFSGLQLQQAFVFAGGVDDVVESVLDYAFSAQHGYLTACPTNAGTGLRSSVMVHLPGLVGTNQAGKVLSAIGKLGVAVRGLYGEGTEAAGSMFQVSNQITLGQSEAEIVNNLIGISGQIINQERKARALLMSQAREQVEDRVWRAYGILRTARILSSDEALKLWSDVRMGAEMNLIRGLSRQVVNELLMITRPAFLQYVEGREMSPFERDCKRAALVRERLTS
ncbi:MAG: protein arginine kinase [Firmicutes bacterium]|jgi:protein arginine kinase|nr:protein arginine kinase [Bacillota bacterium]